MKRLPPQSLLLLAALPALYAPAVFGSGVFFDRDIYNYWKPHVDWALESLASGQTIAWNPGLQFGLPFLADPNFQVFYPPTWLLIILSPPAFYAVLVVGHGLLGAFGMNRLLRAYSFENGALVGGLAFALSGPFVSVANLWHHYCTAAWIPWVLCALREVNRSEGRAFRPLALFAAAAALAGSAETLAMAVVIGVFIEGADFMSAPRLRGLIAGLGIAACLASVQWLPAWEALRTSARDTFTPIQKLSWSVSPAELATVVTRSPGPVAGASVGDPQAPAAPLMTSVYLGAFLAPFAVLGGIVFPRAALPLALFLAGSLGRHLGGGAEVVAALIPFRYPAKLLIGASIAWAILVGAGVHTATRRTSSGAGPVGALVTLLSAGLIGLRILGMPTSGSAFAGLLGLGAMAALWRPPAPFTLVFAAFADLFTAHASTHRYASRDVYRFLPRSAEWLQKAAPLARIFTPFPSETWIARDLEAHAPMPASALALATTEGLVPPHGLSFGLRHGFSPDFTGLASREDAAWRSRRSREPVGIETMLSLGAIDFVVATADQGTPAASPSLVTLPGLLSTPVRIEPWGRVARAAIASEIRFVGDLDAAMRAVAEPGFAAGIASVVVDPARAGQSSSTRGGHARIVRDENDLVEIETETEAPAMLILRDSHRAGWEARVNGQAAEILRADVLFRALPVPEGRAKVSFRYRTPGLIPGLVLSLAGMLALLVGPVRRSA